MAVQSSFVNRIARVESKAPKREHVEVVPQANIRLPIIAGGLIILAAAAGLAFTLAINTPEDAVEETQPSAPRVLRMNG